MPHCQSSRTGDMELRAVDDVSDVTAFACFGYCNTLLHLMVAHILGARGSIILKQLSTSYMDVPYASCMNVYVDITCGVPRFHGSFGCRS